MGLDNSQEIRDLMADPMIKQYINKGRLNVVFFKSAQKFDMLGQDNYYGGITKSINHDRAIKAFNSRMSRQSDQMTGFNLQGLTHLHRYADNSLKAYQQAIIDNTNKLYSSLDKKGLIGKTNLPLHIAANSDPSKYFLDITAPGIDLATKLQEYAEEHHLPLTSRASFGFVNSNLTDIGNKYRLTIGLEDEKTIEAYVKFFEKLQTT